MFGIRFRTKVLNVLLNGFKLSLIMDLSSWRTYYKKPIEELTQKYHKTLKERKLYLMLNWLINFLELI